MSKHLDTIGWYIVNLHQLLGHNKAAAILGQPPYNRDTCILCLYDKDEVTREQVIERIGKEK